MRAKAVTIFNSIVSTGQGRLFHDECVLGVIAIKSRERGRNHCCCSTLKVGFSTLCRAIRKRYWHKARGNIFSACF
jgi:hypothetical protein